MEDFEKDVLEGIELSTIEVDILNTNLPGQEKIIIIRLLEIAKNSYKNPKIESQPYWPPIYTKGNPLDPYFTCRSSMDRGATSSPTEFTNGKEIKS